MNSSQSTGDRTIHLQGRITQSALDGATKQVGEWLRSSPPVPPVFIDLQATDFIDSSGLSWLLVWHKRLASAGGKLVVHSAPPMVMDVLRMMRLDRVLHVADSADAARDQADAARDQAEGGPA